jgi:hypothetical protein
MPNCFLIILFGVVTALLPDYVVYYLRSNYYPSDAQIIFQERKINRSKIMYSKRESNRTNTYYNGNYNQSLLPLIEESIDAKKIIPESKQDNPTSKNENGTKNDKGKGNKKDCKLHDNNNMTEEYFEDINNITEINRKDDINTLDEASINIRRPKPMISKKLSKILIEKNENNIEFPLRSKSTILNQSSLLYQKSFMTESDMDIESIIQDGNKNGKDKPSFFIKRKSMSYIYSSDDELNKNQKTQEKDKTQEMKLEGI